MRRFSISLALLFAAAATQPALADSKADKAKAKTLYEDGLKHYNLAEWQDAIKSWKESYLISKKPLLLFNIGQAYRLSGDCKQAMVFYDSYQREEPNPKNQAELDEALGLCAKQQDKPADKPTDKPIDNKPIDRTKQPPDKPIGAIDKPDVKPDHPVVAQKPEGSEQPEPTDTGPQTTGGGMRKIGIGVGGAGVVMVGVGVFFGLQASKASSDLDGYTGPWGPTQVDTEARGQRDQKLAFVLGGVGAAAIIAGGVMFAIGGPKTVESGTVSLVPTHGGAAIGWSGSF
ncbi:MAG TPA: tetratricopeptide repeat protein [Kofleriaceae bacterium]|nr:tetratricopeptide repeat protein [Kofleriaceae bacterium]